MVPLHIINFKFYLFSERGLRTTPPEIPAPLLRGEFKTTPRQQSCHPSPEIRFANEEGN